MELEELRASWNVLNERLAENEILNQRMVKEMISQKTKSAFDKIYHMGLYNLFVIFFMMTLVFPWIYMHTPMMFFSFAMVEVVMGIGLLLECRKIYWLSQFNMEQKSSKELMNLTLHYKKAYYEAIVWSVALVCLVLVAFYVAELGFNERAGYEISLRILLPIGLSLATCAFGYLVGLWQRRRHAAQLQEIEQGLKELKEFEN
jgi:hypothetical protein